MADRPPGPDPLSTVSSVRTRRYKRNVVESFGCAAATIGPVEPGLSVFCVTRGQFSLLDAILHVCDQLGPSRLSCWTWALSDFEIEGTAALMARGHLLSGRLMISDSIESRLPAAAAKWRERFGDDSIRVCRNHAKMARLWNDRYKVLIRGSCNLSRNPRFEQMDITEGGPEFDLVARIEEELPVLPPGTGHAEYEASTKIGRSFDVKGLPMFNGIKPWSPTPAK